MRITATHPVKISPFICSSLDGGRAWVWFQQVQRHVQAYLEEDEMLGSPLRPAPIVFPGVFPGLKTMEQLQAEAVQECELLLQQANVRGEWMSEEEMDATMEQVWDRKMTEQDLFLEKAEALLGYRWEDLETVETEKRAEAEVMAADVLCQVGLEITLGPQPEELAGQTCDEEQPQLMLGGPEVWRQSAPGLAGRLDPGGQPTWGSPRILPALWRGGRRRGSSLWNKHGGQKPPAAVVAHSSYTTAVTITSLRKAPPPLPLLVRWWEDIGPALGGQELVPQWVELAFRWWEDIGGLRACLSKSSSSESGSRAAAYVWPHGSTSAAATKDLGRRGTGGTTGGARFC